MPIRKLSQQEIEDREASKPLRSTRRSDGYVAWSPYWSLKKQPWTGGQPRATTLQEAYNKLSPEGKASFNEAGPQERDQLFRKLFNMDSPLGIEHLQQLVGKSNVLNGLRTVVSEAMEKAHESVLNNLPGAKALTNVKNALGIGTKNGELVLAQALKGSKVNVDSIKKLFNLMQFYKK